MKCLVVVGGGLKVCCLLVCLVAAAQAAAQQGSTRGSDRDVEATILQVTSAHAAAGELDQAKQEESYQRVYEAFTKLVDNVSSNSLGNVRRLVSRLNQLVGGQTTATTATAAGSQVTAGDSSKRDSLSEEEKRTEQILSRLDGVNKGTDQHTLRQLNEDVSKLVGTLSDSYLRNIRRVIERVNRVVGRPAVAVPADKSGSILHQEPEGASSRQTSNGNEDDPNRQPGFPGWDELLVAVDRVQKSLASFVRSSTKLITSGRRR